MRVFTSYFAKSEKLRQAGITPIGIALYPPKWFRGTSLMIVAPKRYMLNDSLTEKQYTDIYKTDVLHFVDPNSFLRELERIGHGADVALCCYEKPGDFCHRHILAEWLMARTGMEVEEYGATKEELAPAPAVEQQSLF